MYNIYLCISCYILRNIYLTYVLSFTSFSLLQSAVGYETGIKMFWCSKYILYVRLPLLLHVRSPKGPYYSPAAVFTGLFALDSFVALWNIYDVFTTISTFLPFLPILCFFCVRVKVDLLLISRLGMSTTNSEVSSSKDAAMSGTETTNKSEKQTAGFWTVFLMSKN